ELVDQFLCPADSEGGYDYITAPAYGLKDDIHQLFNTVRALFVYPAAIGGFHDDIVGFLYYFRIPQDRTVPGAQISRTDQFGYAGLFGYEHFDDSRAQYMPRVIEHHPDIAIKFNQLIIKD